MVEIKELFVEYEELRRQYRNLNYEYQKAKEQKERNNLLLESIKSSDPSIELSKVNSDDKILNILSWNEQLDSIIADKLKQIQEKDKNMKEKEYELRKVANQVFSYNLNEQEIDKSVILNTIYLMKYIDRYKAKYIGIKLHYSKTQIYRYLEEINKKIKDGTKWDKMGI